MVSVGSKVQGKTLSRWVSERRAKASAPGDRQGVGAQVYAGDTVPVIIDRLAGTTRPAHVALIRSRVIDSAATPGQSLAQPPWRRKGVPTDTISLAGDPAVRVALFEAAHVLITRVAT